MENLEYYWALAERIFFLGANRGKFSNFTKYKNGRNSQDLERAIKEGGLDGFGQTPPMAVRLYEILEIDTEAFDRKYGKPERE